MEDRRCKLNGGSIIQFDLEPQKTEGHDGIEIEWHNLLVTIKERCDGGHSTVTEFYTVTDKDIELMVYQLNCLRNKLRTEHGEMDKRAALQRATNEDLKKVGLKRVRTKSHKEKVTV